MGSRVQARCWLWEGRRMPTPWRLKVRIQGKACPCVGRRHGVDGILWSLTLLFSGKKRQVLLLKVCEGVLRPGCSVRLEGGGNRNLWHYNSTPGGGASLGKSWNKSYSYIHQSQMPMPCVKSYNQMCFPDYSNSSLSMEDTFQDPPGDVRNYKQH